MPTITLISGSYRPDRDGVSDYTARLRTALDVRRITSVVLTTHAAATASDDPTVRGVVADWRLQDMPRLARAIQRTPADLLHIQHAAGSYGFQRALFVLPLLLRTTGWRKPIVATLHEYGWWEWEPRFVPTPLLEAAKQWGQQRHWWDREDGFLLTKSDALVTTHAYVDALIAQRLPRLRAQVTRIPIGTNIDLAPVERTAARHALRQRLGWPNDALVVAFFGFLHPVKGLETLLQAFCAVRAQQPQARLVLVGGVESLALPGAAATAYWDKLHALIAELELQPFVHLTGYCAAAESSRWLSGADVGVLPFNQGVTLKSGSLLALLGHSLPTVATRHAPPEPELEVPFVTLVPPRDGNALAAALVDLLSDAQQRTTMGKAAQRFAHRFTWPAIAQQHAAVYASLGVAG